MRAGQGRVCVLPARTLLNGAASMFLTSHTQLQRGRSGTLQQQRQTGSTHTRGETQGHQLPRAPQVSLGFPTPHPDSSLAHPREKQRGYSQSRGRRGNTHHPHRHSQSRGTGVETHTLRNRYHQSPRGPGKRRMTAPGTASSPAGVSERCSWTHLSKSHWPHLASSNFFWPHRLRPEEVATCLAEPFSSVPRAQPGGAGTTCQTIFVGPREVREVGPEPVREIRPAGKRTGKGQQQPHGGGCAAAQPRTRPARQRTGRRGSQRRGLRPARRQAAGRPG
jgi:hypothetical protein